MRKLATAAVLTAGLMLAACGSDTGSAVQAEPQAKTEAQAPKAKKGPCHAIPEGKYCTMDFVVKSIKDGKVKLGMSKRQVRRAIGEPNDADNSSMELMGEVYHSSIWSYNKFDQLEDNDMRSVTLTFENGKLDSKSVSN